MVCPVFSTTPTLLHGVHILTCIGFGRSTIYQDFGLALVLSDMSAVLYLDLLKDPETRYWFDFEIATRNTN